MNKIIFYIYLVFFMIYQFIYKLILIYKGELFQYILNPLILFVFALISYVFFYKKKNTVFKYEKNILNIIILNCLIYIVLYYSLGFFTGYVNNPYSNSLNGLIINTFSIVFSIFSIELIRGSLINEIQDKNSFHYLMIFIIIIIYDLNLNLFITNKLLIKNVIEEFLPVIINNLFYIYLLKKSRFYTSFLFRFLIFFPSLIVPIVPDINIAVLTLINILLPFFSFLVIEYSIRSHEKFVSNDIKETLNPKKWIITFSVLIIIIFFSLGVFSIRPVVILTESMNPTIYPGDLLIIKKCEVKSIKTGDIIEFNIDNYTVVHRVVKIKKNNNKIQLITKGDNNKKEDPFGVSADNLNGCLSLKLKYLGLPSLYINKILKSGKEFNINENND